MTWQEKLALLIRYAGLFLTCWIVCTIIMILADGAVLTITGTATGQGFTNVTVEADFIAANISRSSWEIIAGGMA